MLTPLIVAPDMTVISGHQRLKASKDLGFTTVPIIIRQDIKTEEDKMAVLLATNYGRPDSAKKKRKIADEYVRLRGNSHGGNRKSSSDNHNLKLTQEQIAKELGVSVPTQNPMLDIERKLTPELKEMLDAGMFTETTASKILVRLSPKIQEKLITTYGEKIIEGVTAKQMQEYVDKIKSLEIL